MKWKGWSAIIAACGGLACLPAWSESYPVKPVRIVVPAAPGGGVDIIARMLAGDLSRSLHQQFIVENRSPYISAVDFVAKSPADGYTLTFTTATYLVNSALHRDLPYQPLRDFLPVSLVGSTPIIINSHPSLPVTTVKALVALAKQKPGALNFGSGGNGSPLHLAGELFKQMTHVDIVHVPYKGTAPAAIDLLAGQVQLMFPSVISMYPYIKAGRVRTLAVMGERRSATIPDIPTTVEAGYPGLIAGIWYGLLAPAATPRPIVEQLHQGVVKAIATSAFKERLAKDDVEPIGNTPEEFAKFAEAEFAKWSRIITAANIRAE